MGDITAVTPCEVRSIAIGLQATPPTPVNERIEVQAQETSLVRIQREYERT